MPEVAPVNPDILKNPEKYMELEIRQIEEEERKLAEAEDMKNGKPQQPKQWASVLLNTDCWPLSSALPSQHLQVSCI